MQDSPAGGQNLKTTLKKKWREDAVSPVIATILMVAITVVLAAVLYLLVSGLITGGTTEPNINIRSGEPVGAQGQWELKVGSVSTGEGLTNYQVAVKKGASIVIAATDMATVKTSGATGGGLFLNYSDATDDDKLNGGDWFTLEWTDTSSDYQVIIYWKSSGNAVSGDTGNIEQ